MANFASALRYGGVYLSLLELYFFINVAVVAETSTFLFQEQLDASRVRLVTLATSPCFEGSVDIPVVQITLYILMTLKA